MLHDLAARKLATILEQVTTTNDLTAWMRLLYFPSRCLHVPKRGGSRWNLAKSINQQLAEESDPLLTLGHFGPRLQHSTRRKVDSGQSQLVVPYVDWWLRLLAWP